MVWNMMSIIEKLSLIFTENLLIVVLSLVYKCRLEFLNNLKFEFNSNTVPFVFFFYFNLSGRWLHPIWPTSHFKTLVKYLNKSSIAKHKHFIFSFLSLYLKAAFTRLPRDRSCTTAARQWRAICRLPNLTNRAAVAISSRQW